MLIIVIIMYILYPKEHPLLRKFKTDGFVLFKDMKIF